MNMKTSDLIGREVVAMDGEVGKIRDLYFDDERWVIRYLVIETGDWMSRRSVLVSPISVTTAGDADTPVSVNLTQAAIATGPDASSQQPVSRRFELEFSKHYEYPIYWVGGGLWGGAMNPAVFAKNVVTEEEERDALDEHSDESHLRSIEEVTGYHVQATDGSIGHIEDFQFGDETWQILETIVDTRNLLPGRKVVIAVRKIDEIIWADSSVVIHMTREAIKESPEMR
jgi:sporulation protein YlmC with PRC-barrel domain